MVDRGDIVYEWIEGSLFVRGLGKALINWGGVLKDEGRGRRAVVFKLLEALDMGLQRCIAIECAASYPNTQ